MTPFLLAGAWSVALAVAGTAWTLTGRGYPFGPVDPGAAYNALGTVPATVGAPLAAALGVAGAVLASVMLRDGRSSAIRRVAVAAATVLAAFLGLVVVDYRVLVVVAYTPLFIVGLPFGWLSVEEYVAAFSPQIVAQLLAMIGGIAWAWAAYAFARRSFGLGHLHLPAWAAPRRAARWGRWATAIAVAVPLVYAATRWAWALGIPLGITDELLRYGRETDLWIVGAGLATLAALGGLVTTGLTLPWGERWPSWVPRIGGRPVPVLAVVVPAWIVAALVTSAGLMFVRITLNGTFDEAFAGIGPIEGSWAALLPELLWPLWGIALAVAALAYALRRQER